MLYTFSSRAAGSVLMTGPVAERMLAIAGKDATAQGIWTVEQIPAAIAALQAAIERERAEGGSGEGKQDEPGAVQAVSLAQRAWPLIDLLQTAYRKGKPVTWGV